MIFVSKLDKPKIFSSQDIKSKEQKLRNFYLMAPENRSQKRPPVAFDTKFKDAFIPELITEFNDKCAYCESRVNLYNSPQYDHFRPINNARGFEDEVSEEHYWWLTYEWYNIYLSCQTCSRYKATWFPVEGLRMPVPFSYEDPALTENPLLVDPCRDDPKEHFAYELNGTMIGLSKQGKTTIEIIKLNREELVNERKYAIIQLRESFSIFESLYTQNGFFSDQLEHVFRRWRDQFSENSTHQYLGVQEYFLRNWLNEYELDNYLFNRNFAMPSQEDIANMRNQVEKPRTIRIDFEDGFDMEDEEFKQELNRIKHIYIERLEIHNFKCFDDLTIHFNNRSYDNDLDETFIPEQGEPWMMFLGENGVGKSSVLKALTIGISGREYLENLGITGSDLLSKKATSGYVKVYFVGSIKPATVEFTADFIQSNISLPMMNFVAYNAVRLKPTHPGILPEKAYQDGARARNLFNYTSSLIDGDQWLIDQLEEDFNRVALTLKDLMSLDEDEYIERSEGRAVLKRQGRTFYIDELSDGYQSIFYVALDIMATIQKKDMPYEVAEGMVILDEIGAHLHPRWRMEVVGKLRRAFPRMRFVVSTHEPLCLRGMWAGETMVLRKDADKKIKLLSDLPNPAELRIDQILTSDFFGLNSTLDSQTEKHFSEYYQLLAKAEKELSGAEIERLAELRKLVPKIRNLGGSERDSIIYDVVDKLLAEKKASNPFRTVQEIKKEAFARLQKIWSIK